MQLNTITQTIRQTVDPSTPLPAVVDELVEVQTAIAVLEALEANLKATLVASGLKEVCGSTTRAVISTTKAGVTTSWKQVAEYFSPTDEDIARFSTKKDPVTSVRIYGFN